MNGYGNEELPDYRKLGGVTALGTFSGPWGSGVKNQPLSAANVDREDWDELFMVEFRDGIAGYSDLLRSESSDNPVEKWPAHYTQQYQFAFIEGMALMDAWKVIPRGAIINLTSKVRSRVLGFAAELERMKPDAGESITDITPEAKDKITAYVYGDNANLALTHGDVRGGQSVSSSGHTASRNEAGRTDRMWFMRHPWWSAAIVGAVVGLPGVYLAIWGTELP